MTREQSIISHLNMTEKRIENFVITKDHQNAMRMEMYQMGQLQMLNSLGYHAIEDEDACKNVDGIWISKYIRIEGEG